MRVAIFAVLLLAGLARGVPAQVEIVTGFRGYPWGTPVEAIPEIAGTEQVGEKDGLRIFAADVRMFGQPALVGFYFHPRTGGLVEGVYVFALTLSDCHPMWASFVEQVEADYPGLVVDAQIPSRANAHRPVYDTDCEYFVYNSHLETWSATYQNPNPPDDRVMLWMRTIERTPRFFVVYRGAAGQVWADRPDTERPPPGDDGRE